MQRKKVTKTFIMTSKLKKTPLVSMVCIKVFQGFKGEDQPYVNLLGAQRNISNEAPIVNYIRISFQKQVYFLFV